MRRLFLAMSVATACLCAPGLAHAQDPLTSPEQISEDASIPDPWQGFNRNMYAVNDAADHAVLEPVARGYRAVAPRFVRTGVNNFLHNLGSPVTFVNDLLQGQVKRAGVTAARLGINSTLGVLGLLDPASDSITVQRPQNIERLEDHQRQSALQNIRLLFHKERSLGFQQE